MNRKYSRWSLCCYVSCCLKEKIITLRVRLKQILKRRRYWNVPERLWDERLRPSCVIACFKGTSPGGVHWTFVVRRCCSWSHLWGSSCIDLRLLQLSKFAYLSVSEILHVYCCLLHHNVLPRGCGGVSWLAQEHDSARICSWIWSDHITQCARQLPFLG